MTGVVLSKLAKVRCAQEMRALLPAIRDISIATSLNVVDARGLFQDRAYSVELAKTYKGPPKPDWIA